MMAVARVFEPLGRKWRPAASAFQDFPIAGPRTTGWIFQELVRTGMSPVQRHHWWRQILGATSSDPGIDEHLFLCEIIELATTYDQLNCYDLAALECVSGRLQLWEERYGEKLRSSTDGSGPSGHAEERQLFMGGSRARGRSL